MRYVPPSPADAARRELAHVLHDATQAARRREADTAWIARLLQRATELLGVMAGEEQSVEGSRAADG
jgi:hypothetical protein